MQAINIQNSKEVGNLVSMRNKCRLLILTIMAVAICLMATGCMGGQKDITKDDEKKYEAVVAEACEEYGYEYEKQTVFPLGAELLYHLTNGDKGVILEVRIDEESTYDKVSCDCAVIRTIDSVDDRAVGIEEHLDVLVKITEHFTDEVTKDVLVEYLNSEDWTEEPSEEFIMEKAVTGSMTHTIYENDGEIEEVFNFWWDNGKKYKLKQD